MPIRQAEAIWEGNLREGRGRMKLSSVAFEGAYSYPSRFEDGGGTNPEELLGAAHAGCFSMAFSAALTRAGYTPEKIHTTASVHLEKLEEGFTIVRINLKTKVKIPGIQEDAFLELAEGAKKNCPISRALSVPEITLEAQLVDEP
ncbi:MAG: peroxiredoxin [Chloroflexi bacterium RBG_16_48_8]|nr:MAG: peroxiredoxin [Chloroflexi bacterium RBG_16_48_8]